MNAWKGSAAGRIRLRAEQEEQGKKEEQREAERWEWGWGWGGGGFVRGAEGQDVCLPMSRDSERKRSRECDEKGEVGEKR